MNDFIEAERLVEISKRIDEMRSLYKKGNHYDRFYLQKDAKELQNNLNRSIGRFKSKLKKKYYFDDFIVWVISNVF